MKFRLIIILCIAFFLSGLATAQKPTMRQRIMAEHIYNFGVYVKWKKDNKFDKFRIGFVGKDTVIFNLVRNLCRFRLLKWKTIEVLHFEKPEEITETQILYVNYEMNDQIDDVLQKIEGNNVLLVTDSCKNRSVMINFFPEDKFKRVEINKENIEAAGLKVSPLLFIIASKYEENWQDLYMQSEELLKEQKELVDQQKKTLEEQIAEINKRQSEILLLNDNVAVQKSEITRQKSDLSALLKDIEIQKKSLMSKMLLLTEQEDKIKKQQSEITGQESLIKDKMSESAVQSNKLLQQKTEISLQQDRIKNQKEVINRSIENIKKQQLILYFFMVFILLVLCMSFFIYRNYRNKKKAAHYLEIKNNEISKQNSEITQQKEEIEAQRDEISAQRDEIEAQRDLATSQRDEITHQKKEITDSIQYASRIQSAILPPKIFVDAVLHEYFIFYKPRDIVSGDFYWIRQKENKTYIAVADCTGHGVPGAFMSMLGVAFLNEIVNKQGHLSAELTAGAILDHLKDNVVRSLHQTGRSGESKDGMDISLCIIDRSPVQQNGKTRYAIQFSGANNPIYLVRKHEPHDTTESFQHTGTASNAQIRHFPGIVKGQKFSAPEDSADIHPYVLVEFRPDKMPIGFYHIEDKPFTTQRFFARPEDSIYMFSDGFADQFGGPRSRKFKYSRLKELLLENQIRLMHNQKEIIAQTFENWKGNIDQLDDILLLGFKI